LMCAMHDRQAKRLYILLKDYRLELCNEKFHKYSGTNT
jgi:hypothetical protein